jgi:APA family basic amino acid/polyamine antiporter
MASLETTAFPRGRLLTVLGVGFGIAVTIGNAVGAGILRTPGSIAGHLQTFWPFIAVWIGGAIYAVLGANALAELGTMVQRSGGQYVFVRHGLGDYAGLVVGWSDWISTCGTTAAVAIVVGEYVVGLFPEARTQQVVALAVVALLTLVQWIGVRAGSAAERHQRDQARWRLRGRGNLSFMFVVSLGLSTGRSLTIFIRRALYSLPLPTRPYRKGRRYCVFDG